MRADDLDWHGGRVFSLVYDAGDDVQELMSDAARMYAAENGLNPLVFPSVGRMQQDIVDITIGLLAGIRSAGPPVEGLAGWTTSGGTESILMAVKTAREWGRATRDEQAPEIVVATSAHAAFSKAAHYFGLKTVRVPVGDDYRADVDAMAAAMTEHTVLVVASAPQYPQGVIDPVAEIAALAADAGALLSRRRVHGRLPPPVPRAGREDRSRRTTSGSRASRRCRPTCTSTGTRTRGCRSCCTGTRTCSAGRRSCSATGSAGSTRRRASRARRRRRRSRPRGPCSTTSGKRATSGSPPRRSTAGSRSRPACARSPDSPCSGRPRPRSAPSRPSIPTALDVFLVADGLREHGLVLRPPDPARQPPRHRAGRQREADPRAARRLPHGRRRGRHRRTDDRSTEYASLE